MKSKADFLKSMAKNQNSNKKKQTDTAAREESLRELFQNAEGAKEVIDPLITDVVFLEGRLTELRELQFIRVHPSDPTLQKPTIAAKQYKELLQQYNNCIKILCGVLRKDSGEEESPLRAFLNSRIRDE